MKFLVLTVSAVLLVANSYAVAQEADFVPLFNGQDFTGWQRVNTDESTWSIKDEMLICSGKPIGELRTKRMYQNFVLEVEWRHMKPKGNAGIFIWADDITAKGQPFHRGIEVQVLENAYGNSRGHTTHGDIFPIHGAKMMPVNGRGGSRAFPTEMRSKPSPEWNHYRIVANDGEISLAVNGKVVTEGKECNPRKGYICIESEGGIVHYRSMRIKELPNSKVDPAMVAMADRGYRCLYTGINLDAWEVADPNAWKSRDWILAYVGSGAGNQIATKETFGDYGFLFDMKLKEQVTTPTKLQPWGSGGPSISINPEAEDLKDGKWVRFEGEIRGRNVWLSVNGRRTFDREFAETNTGPFTITPGGKADFANFYVRDLEAAATPPGSE